MADEHDDDIAPEVEVGAEMETDRFPQVNEDFEEDSEEKVQGALTEASPAEEEGGGFDDQGDDTI